MLTKKELRHAVRYIKRFKRTKATFDAVREAMRRPLHFGSHGRGTKPAMRKGPQPIAKPKRGILSRIFQRPGQ
jgi:hypothetical protein